VAPLARTRSIFRRVRRALIVLLVAAATAAFASPAVAYPGPGRVTGDTGIHDPSLLIRSSGATKYVLFGTGNVTRVSTDRVQFTNTGPAVVPNPLWWQQSYGAQSDWAPDVSFHNGKYWMYYAVSTFGSQKSAIGLATSVTGDPGTFVDQGIVFSSAPGANYNAIDPNLLVDGSGRWWLTFGSFWHGIYMMSLNPATGKPTTATPPLTHLAERTDVSGDPIEAPVVFQHGGYYYLFVSFDYCCRGVNSTYSVHVGRSTSPTGPYVGPAGVNMLAGGGGLVLASHDNVHGPGGQSVVHDSDHDLLIYHYYDANRSGQPFLGINFLGWDANGWPYVW
jgi:arabinan endo-1,5-alpha-L-arabinosidase